jgi:hypothetical protein
MLHGKRLLTVINGCMDLVWLYAWAVFTTSALIPRTFPLPACGATFCMAAVITRLVGYRGWRVITVGLFHLAGLFVGVGIVLHGILMTHYPFWRVGEWVGALGGWNVAHKGFRIAVVCFWTISIWVGGMRLVRRPVNYHSVSARFDLGLGAFFVLFLIQLLIRMKYGAPVHHDMTGYLMLSFFAFGVFAVGLARNQTEAEKSFMGRHSGVGLLLGFSVLVLLVGTGTALMILPSLSEAARVLHDGINTVGAQVEPILTKIITFIFRPLASGTSTGSGAADAAPLLSPPGTGGRISILGLILLWAVLGSMGAVILFLLGKFIWYAIRRLFSRTAKAKRGKSGLSLPLTRLLSFLQALIRLLFKRRDALGVVELYSRLVSWGKRSGIPRAFHETPLEYEGRLTRQFPDAGPEFGRITNAYNLTVYGEASEDQVGLQEARGAWRKLLRLWLWLARLKSLWRTKQRLS